MPIMVPFDNALSEEAITAIKTIATEMGVRTRRRTISAVVQDIERYIEVSRYKTKINPTGVLSSWP